MADEARLTPYQGKKRTFGFFECPTCDNDWVSAYSWANTAQKCVECLEYVYPFSQRPLLRRRRRQNNDDPGKKHKTRHCQKCNELGESCTQIRNAD